MLSRSLLALLFTGLCILSAAQSKDSYEKKLFIQNNDTLPYRLLLPAGYDARKSYPLVLFLHGSGERGRDNEAQLTHGWKLFLLDSNRVKYPAIIVFPQCPQTSFWSNVKFSYDSVTKKRIFNFNAAAEPTIAMKGLLGLMSFLKSNYRLKSGQIYVGGLSMGGMGTFELLNRMPKTFAAAFPICGGGDPSTSKKIRHTSFWIFHGLKDDVVPPEYSQVMAQALKQKNADVNITLYPDANHNSWDSAFAEKDLLTWLFSKHK